MRAQLNRTGLLFGIGLVLLLIVGVGSGIYTRGTTASFFSDLTIVDEWRLTDESWDFFWWSPDGSRLLLSWVEYGTLLSNQEPVGESPIDPQTIITDSRLAIIQIDTSEVLTITQPGIGAFWSLDGNSILIREHMADLNQDSYSLYSLEDDALYPLPDFPQTSGILLWTEEGILYQRKDGLWLLPAALHEEKQISAQQLMLADPVHLLAYDASDDARWALPAPGLGSFVLSDNTDLEHRRWWLVQADGERREMDPPLYGLGICCRWSPDGSQLAYFGKTTHGQNLYLVDRMGGNRKELISGAELGKGAFLTLDFSPDGKQLIFVYAHAGKGFPFDKNRLYTIGVNGKGLKQLDTPSGKPHNWLSWSPDGHHIAFYDETRRVWIAELKK